MVKFRRPQSTIGRSPYALRMTYPSKMTEDNQRAIFREIQRWADNLPLPNVGAFTPYFIEYKPEDPQEVWDENLVEILQSTFTTDLMPTGTWLVHAQLSPTEVPIDAVGVDATLLVTGPNIGTGSPPYESIGYMDGEAIRVVDNIAVDFTAETVDTTYKWFLPSVGGGIMLPKPMSLNLVKVDAADDSITVEGSARAATITDPDAGPEIEINPIPSFLYVWAYRLSDGYNIPTSLEDITPA